MPSHLGVFFSSRKRFIIWNIMRWGENILSIGKKFISLLFLKRGRIRTVGLVQLQLRGVYQVSCLFPMNPLAAIDDEILWKLILNATFPTLSSSVDHSVSLITRSWKFLYLTCTQNYIHYWVFYWVHMESLKLISDCPQVQIWPQIYAKAVNFFCSE